MSNCLRCCRPSTSRAGCDKARPPLGRFGEKKRNDVTGALINTGVSPELRMKLTGHKSAEIHRGYTHLELETLKEAIKKLPGLPTDTPG